MFGNKLRAWMDAVRPRKKQNRKEKQNKNSNSNNSRWKNEQNRNIPSDIIRVQEDERRETIVKFANKGQTQIQSGPSGMPKQSNTHSRYSANNLSSPESAYSTGYSTDGTSPGAPPDYLITNRTTEMRYYPIESENNYVKPVPMPLSPCITRTINPTGPKPTTVITLSPAHFKDRRRPSLSMIQDSEEARIISAQARQTIKLCGSPALGLTSPALGMTTKLGVESPRQRNRIRTNQWIFGTNSNSFPNKQDFLKNTLAHTNRTAIVGSPRPARFHSPTIRRRSLSSSSGSSAHGSTQWEPHRSRSNASDEDTTLNEMMGKYDESYVYEKETDILSDSDPTDCDTDIDTGQDGGDEEDTHEDELDFIDNGSYLDFDPRPDRNTGHCLYYNYESQRKTSSRRRNTRRNKSSSDKRRRSCSNKKRHKQSERDKYLYTHLDGSKSAGATPVSVRRCGHKPVSKLALEDCLKKRSNSISFCRYNLSTIDKRDKEADLKYKELIVEAEQILRTMKSNGLSPRRLPGPANKRVELLRTSECTELRPNTDDNACNNQYSKSPSNNYSCPRFSPKKNHITNFIINNSPIMVRREWENQNSLSPLVIRKKTETNEQNTLINTQKSVLYKEKSVEHNIRRSPKYKKKTIKKYRNSSSSEEENGRISRTSFSRQWNSGCPQSEPLRRKVYTDNIPSNGHGNLQGPGKTVAFNLGHETNIKYSHFGNQEYRTASSENLRQQVLLNTIASLKRNLEDQSASLKQVYKSSQNIKI